MAEAVVTPKTPLATVAFNIGSGGSTGTRQSSWRSRKNSAFTKTPGSRPLRSAIKQARCRRTPTGAAAEEEEESTLKELTNKTWRAHRVSPLFQFSHQAAALRQYKRYLCLHLEAERRKGMAVTMENEIADQASITVLKGIAAENEPEAIEFNLKQKGKDGGADKVVLTAVLCSCQVPEETRQTIQTGFTLLPLLLVKGPVMLTGHLVSWLQMQFDCRVSPLSFSHVELSWMVAMWAGSTKEKHSKPVELVYAMPQEVTGMTRIVMDIDAHDCQQLWNCIHDSDSDEFQQLEVERFIHSLEAHFYYHFKIRISAMSLSRIGTTPAYVGFDGHVKLFMAEKVCMILGHLTDLALERTLKSA